MKLSSIILLTLSMLVLTSTSVVEAYSNIVSDLRKGNVVTEAMPPDY
jgi:hypothetical protein